MASLQPKSAPFWTRRCVLVLLHDVVPRESHHPVDRQTMLMTDWLAQQIQDALSKQGYCKHDYLTDYWSS